LRVPLGLVADVVPFSWVDGPGNRSTVFLQGCNFDCAACHNPQTIARDSRHARWLTSTELRSEIAASASYLTGVTMSGGEATVQSDFVRAFFAELRSDPVTSHLTRFIDTNGSATQKVWRSLADVTDGVMVDLKVFDPERHLALTGEALQPVLDSILVLSELGLLFEVRLLPVPGVSDDLELLAATGRWLASIDPAMRVVVNPFHRHGVRAPADAWAEPTAADRERVAAVLQGAGLSDINVIVPPTGRG